MVDIKENLIKLDRFIRPYKKWIILLLVNFYYPFLSWLQFLINPGYGPNVNSQEIDPLDKYHIVIMLFAYIYHCSIYLYFIITNLVIIFSYKVKYRNSFLINYNIFLLFIICFWNLFLHDAYTKSTFVILIFLLILWFYLLVSLIIDLKNKPIKSKKLW